MAWWHWLLLFVGNIPLYVLLGRLVFASWDGFVGSLRYSISPEEWSWLRGERIQDWWAEVAPGVWLLGCTLAVVFEALVVEMVMSS